MAIQNGANPFAGTVGGFVFYKRGDQWLLRSKSSLNKKRVKTDPAFAASRKASRAFGAAAQLAKKIYWQLPKKQRGRGIIGKVIGRVHTKLLAGLTTEATEAAVLQEFLWASK